MDYDLRFAAPRSRTLSRSPSLDSNAVVIIFNFSLLSCLLGLPRGVMNEMKNMHDRILTLITVQTMTDNETIGVEWCFNNVECALYACALEMFEGW